MFRSIRFLLASTVVVIGIPLLPVVSLGWGFWAHKEIHRHAIASLPDGMKAFFIAHTDSLIEKSVEPDLRRNWAGEEMEQYTHYIDIDRYGGYPFAELPRQYDKAVGKFGKMTVDTNGTLPWRIAEFTRHLTEAMKNGNTEKIVFYASNLGHYIADAHVPLHTADNYDGQRTGQRGIHARWESRIPERFGKDFPLAAQPVRYLGDPLDEAFRIVLKSFQRVDSVLSHDRRVQDGIPKDDVYTVVTRRGRTEYQYSDLYYTRYYAALNGMVERCMNESIAAVASYWYTAWVDAGKPELP